MVSGEHVKHNQKKTESVLKLLYTTAVLAFMILSSCGSSPSPGEPGAVITVGSRSVLSININDAFERLRGDTVSVDVLRDNIIARELFIAHAMDLGLQNNRESQRLVHERRREVLQSAWLAWELDKVESDDREVRDFWGSLGTGVSYTALSLRDSLLMDSVAAQVRAGAHLSRFAAEYGLDEVTRRSEGKIVIPDRNYSNLMDLDHLREAVEGDIIGPFPVPVGSRLLQIDSTWTYEPAAFQVDSQQIASMLLARAREARKQFIEDSLMTAFNAEISPEAVSVLLAHSTEEGYTYSDITGEEDTMTAVTWDGGSRDVFSVHRNVINLPGYLPRSTDSEEWTTDYILQLALYDIEMQKAIELGLDTIPETARLLDGKEFEVLLDSYYEAVIGPRITPDSSLIQQTYLEVRDEFPFPESRVFSVLFLADPGRIEHAEAIMESGGDVLTVADQFETFPPILQENEEYTTIPLTRAVVPENDRDLLFSLVPGDETIVDLSDSTALWFRLLEINPERVPEFSEIRDRVVAMAVQSRETSVIESLVDSLEEVYHPYIDEEYFRGFYPQAETDSVSCAQDSTEVNDAL